MARAAVRLIALSASANLLVSAGGQAPVPANDDSCAASGACDGPGDDETGLLALRSSVKSHSFAGNRQESAPRQTSLGDSRPFMPEDGLLGAEDSLPLKIDEDGEINEYYLPGAEIIDDGKTVRYTPPYRFYLMKTPTTDYSNSSAFYRPILPGKTFTVDITLTGVGCGCNVNFYLVDMPASSPGKDGDYYCDAQCFPDMGCCAEFDMNEGNLNVQQITNHACTDDYSDHPDWQCNKWGDPEAKSTQSQFGASGEIDGNKKFTYSQKFDMSSGQLQVVTTLSQDGKQVELPIGPNSQLQAMLESGSLEKGMAFVTGYWTATDMNWLDGDACGSGPETCSEQPALISNWRITTNSPTPTPTPSPSPSPTPTPTPSPSPSPPGGYTCCWGGCGNCQQDISNFCDQSEDHCTGSCAGEWLNC